MNRETYPVEFDIVNLHYEFWSIGPKGKILKVVRFYNVADNLFNLSFGDWNDSLQKNDDFARTNNHDRDKVLATVAKVVLDFLEISEKAKIYARGSTPSRTRLYQIMIHANLDIIETMLELNGYVDDEWRPFEKNRNYKAFMVSKKQVVILNDQS